MRMTEKYRNNYNINKHNNNNSDNPLTSRRTDGGKNRCSFLLDKNNIDEMIDSFVELTFLASCEV